MVILYKSFDTIFIAWDEFPTTSKTLVYPIQKAEFPTVTLCPKNNNPDRWGPAIKIFDYLDRSCSAERYKEISTFFNFAFQAYYLGIRRNPK
jgi:hypothetical protein